MYLNIQTTVNFKLKKGAQIFIQAYNITENPEGIFFHQVSAFTFESSRL